MSQLYPMVLQNFVNALMDRGLAHATLNGSSGTYGDGAQWSIYT
ncbi:hypothetical protein NZD89_06805 [Alicyclobacillus fastidiosus]|uniref:Uncharacterized protein n=1 Tax=Alicyclobacillus fastidiosus TaxID=392011 RepID=A0ABY6ZLX5_9BACL|nr:hypothetical protein [Alicyclobacillus fastidiosus]WAH43109.1 hypothetical protein NZD89_06805 [Alicyclobacillus fastidiosus]